MHSGVFIYKFNNPSRFLIYVILNSIKNVQYFIHNNLKLITTLHGI